MQACAACGDGGWKAFDSSTGFRLPDDSLLSPDATLLVPDRWRPSRTSSAAVSLPSAPIWRNGAHLGPGATAGAGRVGGVEHGPLEFLELLVEIGVAGGVLPR
jgi:hypothetical protein